MAGNAVVLLQGLLWICCIIQPTKAMATAVSCGEELQVMNHTYDYSLDVSLFSAVVVSFISCYTLYTSLSSAPNFPSDHLQAYQLTLSHNEAYLLLCDGCAFNNLMDYSHVPTDPGTDCLHHSNVFWLAWDNDTLLVGQGSEPQLGATTTSLPLLWQDQLLHPITYIGFAGQLGAKVKVSVLNCSSSDDPVSIPPFAVVSMDTTFVTRKPIVTHVLDLSGTTAFTFDTSSCSMTYVELAVNEEDLRSGGNGGVAIVQLSWSLIFITTSVIPYTPYLDTISLPYSSSFDCYTQNMTMWVSTEQGYLRLGVGDDVTVGDLNTEQLKTYNIRYLGFYTDAQATATWTTHNKSSGLTTSTSTVTTVVANPAFSSVGTMPALPSTLSSDTVSSTTPNPDSTPSGTRLVTTWEKRDVDRTVRIRQSLETSTHLDCGRQCLSRAWCTAFWFTPASNQCGLINLTQSSAMNNYSSIQYLYQLV